LDIVAANGGSNKINLYVNHDRGGFTSGGHFDAGIFPHNLVSGDFNGDGKLELVVSNESTVSILLNGHGGFRPPAH
jgi:hypothetical protein